MALKFAKATLNMCETVRNDEFNYIVSKRIYNSYQMTSKLGVLMTTIQFLSLKKKKKTVPTAHCLIKNTFVD